MEIKTRISSFAELGSRLPGLMNDSLLHEVAQANPWFTASETTRALKAWSAQLTIENLTTWANHYELKSVKPSCMVMVIMAGNIPLVGFHDFLSVLIAGHHCTAKLSTRDSILLPTLMKELISIEPRFANLISLDDFRGNPDAVIATGSDNSARYFRNRYGEIPHIIRKNRSSAAILDGTEDSRELEDLFSDMLEYYGLGCRSISHLFLPAGYSPENLGKQLSGYSHCDPCVPFSDNLRYQRSRLEMMNIRYIDARHTLLVENESLHAPVGIVNFSFYKDMDDVSSQLQAQQDEIQCLIGHRSVDQPFIPFGSAQKPQLWEYADQVDTLDFLISLTSS